MSIYRYRPILFFITLSFSTTSLFFSTLFLFPYIFSEFILPNEFNEHV